MTIGPDSAKLLSSQGAALDEWFDRRFAQKMAEYQAGKTSRLSMLSSK